MARVKDRKGQRFGRLIVAEESHRKNGVYWKCICDCGKSTVVRGALLSNGSVKSCGCGSIEQAIKNVKLSVIKRKLPYPYLSKMKDLYRNIIDRCYNPSNKRYQDYGGRGIKVCDLWLNDRRAFYKWCSENKLAPGLSIDRINNDGDYEPGNCRFVDGFVQANNTRKNIYITYNGKVLTVSEWARALGMPYAKLKKRIISGWDIERAFYD